jgi:hypothetical protein
MSNAQKFIKPWNEIISFYNNLEGEHPAKFKELENLCVELSQFEGNLFGTTSCNELSIYQVETPWPPHHSLQRLKVSPAFETRVFKITFGNEIPEREKQGPSEALVGSVLSWLQDLLWI